MAIDYAGKPQVGLSSQSIMMAKKSHKRLVRSERDPQFGCIWGLISIFDFRHGRSTRRLTSGKRRSGKHGNVALAGSKTKVPLLTNGDEKRNSTDGSASDASDHDDSKIAKFDSSKSSVKALIDEEMSTVKQPKKKIPSEAMEQIRVDLETGSSLRESHNDTTAYVGCNQSSHDSSAPKSLENCRSCNSNSMENFSAVEEFLDHNHQYQETPQHERNCSCNMRTLSSTETKSDGIAILEERVGEAAEALLNQKLINVNQLLMGGPEQSKEFMDALEILNSNKDLFLKLLQDPNSLLVQRIQELQNAQGGLRLSGEDADDLMQSQELGGDKRNKKQSKYRFFGRKDKTGEGKNSSKKNDDSPAPNRIVVLKPSSAISPVSSPQPPHFSSRKKGEIEKAVSNFSIKGIKKKLKHAMGENSKEPHWASMDGMMHRLPYEHGNFGDMSRSKECQTSNKCAGDSPGHNSRKKVNTTTIVYSPQREAAIYEEAKKHLADMLDKGVEYGEMPRRKDPRTLARILSTPENNVMAPRSSTEGNKKPTYEHEAVRFSCDNGLSFKKEITFNRLSPLRSNAESLLQTNSCDPEGETHMTDSNSELSERILLDRETQQSICVSRQLSPEDSAAGDTLTGSTEIREIADAVCIEKRNDMDSSSKPGNDRDTNDKCHSIDAAEICEAEGSPECLRLDSSEERPIQVQASASFSGSPLYINKIEDLDAINEKQERPSPVSVLDQFFIEDEAHRSSEARYVDLSIQPCQINFEEPRKDNTTPTSLDLDTSQRSHLGGKESKYEYVRTMLEASGITHNRLMARWHSSDQLLDPSLLYEVEALSMGQSLDDQKLLFDCINEVLVEIYEQFFSNSPWISFVKPNIRPIPIGENLAGKVCEGVDRLLLSQYPYTLDQIVGKDLERNGKWMDLQSAVESVGVDMEEFILDRLMEETILELWDED
ncbi:hypothetical protein ACLOJK_015529 [Asimina triloba]